MIKKKLIFFTIIILLLGLLTYQSIKGEGRFVDFPLYPLKLLEKGSTFLIRSASNVIQTYIFIVGKEEENRNLRAEISAFAQERNRFSETAKENMRLRKILDLKSARPDYIASAEVFARDPTNWFQMVWINKGEQDGITKDMIVVTPAGPVGRIHRVLERGSNVILITDVNSSVAVRLQSSRVEGILEGKGNNRCSLKYISKEVNVETGERIVTSGLDGIYPKGFLIAYVSEVEKEGSDIFQQIEAVPALDLNTVEEVAIFKK